MDESPKTIEEDLAHLFRSLKHGEFDRAEDFGSAMVSSQNVGSTFQNGNRRSVLLRVADAQVNDAPAALLQERLSFFVENDEWFAAFFSAHFHVVPAELRADAGAERFGNRFFRREPRRDEWRGIFVRETIGNFRREQDALHKTFAEFFVRRRDALDFDQVNAGAENHQETFE
jgi:hypothetical protein